MKRAFILLAATMCIVIAAGAASATTASQREYKRGYSDCSNGRYDQNQHGASYKKGCRAAENAMKKKKKSNASNAGVCPPDVSEADRYKYPACGAGAGANTSTGECPPDVSQADRYKYPACN